MSGLRPYPVYLFISGAFGLSFMLYATIASVYRIQIVGLNPLQLVGTLARIRAALAVAATTLSPALLLFGRPSGAAPPSRTARARTTPKNVTQDIN